jgi:RES domain
VLYAGSSPLACFVETLAWYRKPLNIDDLTAALNSIENTAEEPMSIGQVPASWATPRMLGEATATRKRFADIYCAEWLSYLRQRLEPGLMTKRFDASQDFDLALLISQDRKLTQRIATIVYQLDYDGVYYQSRHGTDLCNWALFEPFELAQVTSAPISTDDPNLLQALALLNLTLNPHL